MLILFTSSSGYQLCSKDYCRTVQRHTVANGNAKNNKEGANEVW